ncbi:MAG: hypothetical protein FJZ38_10030 [Candidatus Rokubacteria bacterium]|nr:hypothetical protein [Candidatus Rokubacteria bacterium]
MLQVIAAVVALLLSPGETPAQSAPDRPAAGINRETGAPGSAGPKDDGVVQRGSQPNPGEVRPGSRDGDQPSASAGELQPRAARRIFGLPVTVALIVAAVIVAIVALAGFVIPERRRRARPDMGGRLSRPPKPPYASGPE